MSTVGRGIVYVESDVIVPITLQSFFGFLNNRNQAGLQWNTVTEINNGYFTVERSAAGRIFSGVGSVTSKAVNGNSIALLNYSFNDDLSGMKGVVYYRLKQVDKDGKFRYSGIISVQIKQGHAETIGIYPNPATNSNMNRQAALGASQTVIIRITSMLGNSVYNGLPIVLPAGTSTFSLSNVPHLSSGTYIVELYSENSGAVIARNKVSIR
ncbi:MAG: T9SS type A sorting domain-containing protein [Chitinophagaceae bacterium]